jgi:cytochrome c553
MSDRIAKECGRGQVSSWVFAVFLGLVWTPAALAGPEIAGTVSVRAYARDASVEHVQAVPQLSFTVFGGAHPQNSLSVQEKNPLPGYVAGLNVGSRVARCDVGASYFYVGKGNEFLYQAAAADAAGGGEHSEEAASYLKSCMACHEMPGEQLVCAWYHSK